MDFISPISSLTPLPGSLQGLRMKAAEFAKSAGLPTRKNEDWKYTSVRDLSEESFAPTGTRPVLPSHQTLKNLGESFGFEAFRFVFINGILDRTLSALEDLPKELEWSTSAEKVLNPSAAENFGDSFEALNVAYATEGLWVKIPKEISLEKPLHFHFHTSSEGNGALMVTPRVRVEIGERSVARVLESFSSEGGTEVKHLTNASCQMEMAKASKLLHVRLQDEHEGSFHLGSTTYQTKSGCDLTSLVISTGAKLSRHHLRLPLTESGVRARILGLSVSTGQQHVDNTTDIDHKVGACDTEQVYKSLLDGESRAVFNGRIYIRPQAQKANSAQMNNNLLLSSKAEADSQPQLMIEADDVKAAHGSTVGHLSQEELFYLQSRGLSRDAAIPMLAYGFLADLLEDIDEPTMKDWVTARLKKSFSRLNTEAL